MRPVSRKFRPVPERVQATTAAGGLAKSRRLFPEKRESEISLAVALFSFESEPGMTAPDDLTRAISGLKELLRIAWSRLGDPMLTAFDRREARNQIKQHDAELRQYLQVMEARTRISKELSQKNPDSGPKKPDLRFLV